MVPGSTKLLHIATELLNLKLINIKNEQCLKEMLGQKVSG